MCVAREHMTAGLLLSILPQLRHKAGTNVGSEGKHPALRSFTCASPLCKTSWHRFPFVLLFLCLSCVSSIHASFLFLLWSGWVASSCSPAQEQTPMGRKRSGSPRIQEAHHHHLKSGCLAPESRHECTVTLQEAQMSNVAFLNMGVVSNACFLKATPAFKLSF